MRWEHRFLLALPICGGFLYPHETIYAVAIFLIDSTPRSVLHFITPLGPIFNFCTILWKWTASACSNESNNVINHFENNLLIILRSWWCHEIPGYKLHDYFPKGLLSFLPTWVYQKILSETSFLRALWGREMSRTVSTGSLWQRHLFPNTGRQHSLWSKIPWVSFQPIAQRRQRRQKRPKNRQRSPNWGHCCSRSHKGSVHPHTWSVWNWALKGNAKAP